jgi:cell division septation protein DedD
VADATHDFGDEGFHEIHLSGKQLVFLFMATTVVSVIIFLLGVQVGRGVPVQRSSEPPMESAAAAPNQPSSSAAPPGAGPPAAEPPPPADDGANLSYKERLEEPTPPKETLKQAEPSAAEKRPAPAPAPPPATEPVAGAPQRGTWVLQVHALRDAKVANGIVQRLSKKGYPAFVVSSGAPTSMYRVFVGRYQDRSEAERVAERLRKEEQFKPWITR